MALLLGPLIPFSFPVTAQMNGLFSFVNYGLSYADGGFASYLTKIGPVGDYSTSVGYLAYPYQTAGSNVETKIDELSTLMTAGRLSEFNKQVLKDAHGNFTADFGVEEADRVLLKLLASTPEFHSSDTTRKSGTARDATPPLDKSGSPYKAIVYIHLSGGVDSFNILTPGASNCPLYDEYFEARGKGIGIGMGPDEIIDIDGSSAGLDGCSNLGVHHLLPAYAEIYGAGNGIFFANMG